MYRVVPCTVLKLNRIVTVLITGFQSQDLAQFAGLVEGKIGPRGAGGIWPGHGQVIAGRIISLICVPLQPEGIMIASSS